MSDNQNKIPSFNEVMQNPAPARGVPSFKDIMEEGSKKKDGLGSGIGGEAGTSDHPLGVGLKITPEWENLFKSQKEQELRGIQKDDNDPVKSLITPLQARKNQVVSRQMKVESTGQNKPLKQKVSDEVDSINFAEDYIKNNAFKTIDKAKVWLDQNPDAEKNETSKIAKTIVDDDIKASNALNDTGNDISKSAIQYYSSFDNQLGKQLRVMQSEGIEPPQELVAQLTSSFLQNRTVKELKEKSQDFNNVVKNQEYNFYSQFPEAHNQKLLSDIAQARKDFGANNWFLNLPGTKSANWMAENLVATGKWDVRDLDFYKKNTLPRIAFGYDKIPTPGLIENTVQGAVKGVTDIPKGAYRLTGLQDLLHSKGEILAGDLKEDLSKADTPNFTGLQKWSHATGNLAGVLLPMVGGGSLLKGANIIKNPALANELSMGLTFYNDIEKAERQKNPDSPMLAHLSSLIQSAVWMKLNKTLPKVGRAIVKDTSPEINNVLKQLQSGAIDNSAAEAQISRTLFDKAKSLVEKSGKVLKESNKAAMEVSTAVAINDAVSGVINGDYDFDEAVKNVGHTYENMMLGMPLLSAIKVAGGRDTSADMIENISKNPEYFKEQIEAQAKSDPEFAKQAPELLKNLEYLGQVRSELEARNVPADKMKKYQLISLQEKLLQDKAKSIPDKGLRLETEKQIKEVEIEKDRILNDTSNTEFVEELYNEELLPKGAMMLLELEGKFSPSKVGEYLKFIAQQSNGFGENWKPLEGKAPSMEGIPEGLIEVANERWAKEIEANKPKDKISEPIELDPNLPEGYVGPEKATVETEVNIPKLPTNETSIKEGVEVTERIPPKEEVLTETTTDTTGGEAIPPTEAKATVIEGEGDKGGITHAANEVRRADRKLPEYEKTPQSFEEWNNEAEQKIKEGYDVDQLIDRIEKGHDPTPVENAIRKIYVATLDAEIAKNPTDALLAKQKKFIEVGDLANSRAGRNLVSLKGEGSPLATISDFYVAKMEAAGVDKLTEQQKAETKEAFVKVQSADKNAAAAMEAYREEITRLKAENELLKQKKSPSGKPKVKRNHEDFVKERESYREELKQAKEKHEEWLKEQGIQKSGFGLTLTGDMVKAISKIVKSHVEEKVQTLGEIIDNVFDDIKDIFPSVGKNDIRDVIAGEYNPKKPTRNELAARMRDLRDEAYYVNKLEKLLSGEEPIEERKKIKRNQEIESLKSQIKDVSGFQAELDRAEKELASAKAKIAKQTAKEISKAEREFAKKSPEQVALESIIRRNKKQEQEIKDRIAKGEFEKDKKVPFLEDPEMQKKFPKEYKEALDAIVKREEAHHEFDIALLRDEMSRRNWKQKGSDLIGKTTGTAKAIVTGIDDSAVAIQTYMSLLRRPRTGAKALRQHVAHAFSQKKFNRWLAALHNSSDWKFIKESGLDVTEPQSLKEREKEEIFSNRFSGTVKVKGKEYKVIDAPLKPFERAFTTLGNVARVTAFRNAAEKYKKDGYTWEKDPELFKSLARRLNEQTGRGRLNEHIDRASKIVTLGIWSPRLMASKFNILGISDLSSIFLSKSGTKGYYSQLHPKERLKAIRDVGQFALSVVALSYGVALAMGGEIDTDPWSSTFMDIKLPNGKSVNLTGGFSSYIRHIAQFIWSKKHSDGKVQNVNSLDIASRFFRGKTPPMTAALINMKSGKDFMGQPTTPLKELRNMVTPISVKGIMEQIDRDGGTSFFTQGVPTFFGFNIKDDKDFAERETRLTIKDPETFKERQATKEEYKQYTDKVKEYEEDILEDYTNDREDIWVDVNGKVHISKEGSNQKENETWEFVEYDDLTKEQVKTLEQKVKSKASRQAKKELFSDDTD